MVRSRASAQPNGPGDATLSIECFDNQILREVCAKNLSTARYDIISRLKNRITIAIRPAAVSPFSERLDRAAKTYPTPRTVGIARGHAVEAAADRTGIRPAPDFGLAPASHVASSARPSSPDAGRTSSCTGVLYCNKETLADHAARNLLER